MIVFPGVLCQIHVRRDTNADELSGRYPRLLVDVAWPGRHLLPRASVVLFESACAAASCFAKARLSSARRLACTAKNDETSVPINRSPPARCRRRRPACCGGPFFGNGTSWSAVGLRSARSPDAAECRWPGRLAVSYRRLRSFSKALSTIQSKSPRSSRPSFSGSVWRHAAMLGKASVELRRMLGRGGSSSRISRQISSQAASLNRCRSSGVLPVSNSYRITPSA